VGKLQSQVIIKIEWVLPLACEYLVEVVNQSLPYLQRKGVVVELVNYCVVTLEYIAMCTGERYAFPQFKSWAERI